MRIPSGVTDQYIYFVAVDDTDGVTRETGLSGFTVYRSRNGGAAAAMTTPTVNEVDSTNMPGVYELLLDEDMTIGTGNDSEEMVFHITATGMRAITRTIELYRPKITAGNTLVIGSDGSVSSIGTNGISANSINANAIGASELAADAIAEIAAGVWEGNIFAYDFQNTPAGVLLYGTGFYGYDTVAGTPTTTEIELSMFGPPVDDYLNGMTIVIFNSNTTLPEPRVIVDYNGTTAVATLDEPLSAAPDAGDPLILSTTIHKPLKQQADAILDRTYETGRTVREHLRLAASALWGKVSGAGTGSVVFRDQGDTKNRISATVDDDGNRSAVTTDDT